MALSGDSILGTLREAARPVGVKELMRLAGLNPGQQTEVKRVLRELLRSGAVQKDGKRFQVPRRRHEAAAQERPSEPRADREHGARRGRHEAASTGPQRKAPRHRHEEEGPSRDRFGNPVRRGEERAGTAKDRFGSRAGASGSTRFGKAAAAGGGGHRFGKRDRFGGPERSEGGPRSSSRSPERGADRRGGRSGGERRPRFTRPPPSDFPTVEGILSVHRDGFGFVRRTSGEGDDIFVPASEAARALDNDRVVVTVEPGRGGKFEGRIVEVKERRREQVVGTYEERGRDAIVHPSDDTLPGPIRVPRTQLAQNGDLVKVRLGVGGQLLEPSEGLFGEVKGSLGKPGDPSAEVLSIAFSQGFSDEFPDEVMDEADRVPITVSEQEATGEQRRDLRQTPLVTIDGPDARDFDDAVHAERRGDGWRLVVAIADVTHYVKEGRPLDVEALHRATSVYLPNRVLPMLPERLSAGICSLRPDEDRLCMVADMQIDRFGNLGEFELYPAVMRSAARCTYDEVQAVLDGADVPHRNAFKPHFELLRELAWALNKMRRERGAIDFDLPEYKVVLGDDGAPVRMDKRERKDAHRLVEECMLAANEAVAKFFQDLELPSVYRFHGEPDPDKLEAFSALAQAHGFKLPAADALTSKDLAEFVRKLEGHPEQRALNQLLLRSMMQAVYSSENVGHYGLGAEHYLHFTSPIRRYPDLLVHRLLKREWARQGHRRAAHELERETERLEDMAIHSSERERAAMAVEREVVSFYAALMMKDRVGETFAATVASVVDFGFFVELDDVHVEGLVKAETLGPGFKFDETLHALRYPNGRRIRVGEKLTVRLVSANVERRQIDFEVEAFEGEQPRPDEGPSRAAAPRREREDPRGAPAAHGRPKMRAPVSHAAAAPPSKDTWRPREESPAPDSEFVPDPSSPHPGFDRLRALAASRGGSRSGERSGASGGRQGGRAEGSRSEGGHRGGGRGQGRGDSGGHGSGGGHGGRGGARKPRR